MAVRVEALTEARIRQTEQVDDGARKPELHVVPQPELQGPACYRTVKRFIETVHKDIFDSKPVHETGTEETVHRWGFEGNDITSQAVRYIRFDVNGSATVQSDVQHYEVIIGTEKYFTKKPKGKRKTPIVVHVKDTTAKNSKEVEVTDGQLRALTEDVHSDAQQSFRSKRINNQPFTSGRNDTSHTG